MTLPFGGWHVDCQHLCGNTPGWKPTTTTQYPVGHTTTMNVIPDWSIPGLFSWGRVVSLLKYDFQLLCYQPVWLIILWIIYIIWDEMIMTILPANSEGCWIFRFVLSFLCLSALSFCVIPVLCWHFFVIVLSLVCPLCCHFVVMFYHSIVIVLSFSCCFLIRRGWLDPEPTWKV